MNTPSTCLAALALLLALPGCGTKNQPLRAHPAPPSAPRGAYGEPPGRTAPPHAYSGDTDEGAAAELSAPTEERPGLGTEWGEYRASPVTSAPFSRADSDPFAVTTLYYNDAEGVRAMTHGRYAGIDDCVVDVDHGALTVSLLDAGGRPLRATYAGGRHYAMGHAGERYSIRIVNHTSYRFEAVATVDGLDVIDGEEGDPDKRGYLLDPHGELVIEGFRDSRDSVAAFRFGSVRDSYAARTGKGRDVGVIGVAFFAEEGAGREWQRSGWTHREIERRRTADPFPGRFAEPPPPRW